VSLAGLFWFTPAADLFGRAYFPGTRLADALHVLSITSPAAAAFSVPFGFSTSTGEGFVYQQADWPIFFGHIAFQFSAIGLLLLAVGRLFRNRYDAGEA
jgi:hypothetical protein